MSYKDSATLQTPLVHTDDRRDGPTDFGVYLARLAPRLHTTFY
jgi:hypothetical protein